MGFALLQKLILPARKGFLMASQAQSQPDPSPGLLERMTQWITRWVGSARSFVAAVVLVVVWAVTGPLFGYSDTWQLVINTASSVVTFLMVFIIQRAQNKDTMALQLKMDELIAAVHGASNRMINVENLSEAEVFRLQDQFAKLAARARSSGTITASRTVEEVAPSRQNTRNTTS
jgi:low affinity Fe/Cu permease